MASGSGMADERAVAVCCLGNRAGSTTYSVAESTLDNILVSAVGHGYFAGLLKQPNCGDDFLLSGLNVANADRPQSLHVLCKHFGGTLRHALSKMAPQLGAGA